MPRIVEYTAPTKQVNPSDRPQAAWETAGRRIGPLYNAAAQDIRQAGAVQGQMEKDKIWPFDVYALEAANAPQVRNTTSTETTIRAAPPATTGGARGGRSSGDDDSLLIGNGTSQGADRWIQYANYTNDLADHPWTYEHGEASAGAVGMSQMARAAAGGRRGSGVANTYGDDPDYNGQRIETVDGVSHTPAEWGVIRDRDQKQQDQWQRQLDKWNAAEAKRMGQWNYNRDKAVYDDGEAWRKDYQQDLIAQRKIVDKYMKDNPNADVGEVQRNAYNARHVTPSVQSSYGSYSDDSPDYRIRYGTPTVGDYVRYAPSAIVDSVKSTFNRMFGSDEPAATADIE